MKSVFAAAVLLAAVQASAAPINLTNAAAAYGQNFNTLPALTSGTTPWTDDSSLEGWYASQTAIRCGAGTDTNGAFYSFGSNGTPERAMGALTSSSAVTIQFGVTLNNGGTTSVIGANVSYTGEQWRANNTAANTLAFTYGANATSLTAGTYSTAGAALDFTSPILTTAGPLNANVAANKSNKSGTISLTPANKISPGGKLWLRWTQNRPASGSDHGLAVDDFNVTLTYNDLGTFSFAGGNSQTVDISSGSGNVATTAVTMSDPNVVAASRTATITSLKKDGVSVPNTLFALDTSNFASSPDFALNGTRPVGPTDFGTYVVGLTYFDGYDNATASYTVNVVPEPVSLAACVAVAVAARRRRR